MELHAAGGLTFLIGSGLVAGALLYRFPYTAPLKQSLFPFLIKAGTHLCPPISEVFMFAQKYLVTEYMQGGDLGQCLRNDKAKPRKYGWYKDGRFIALGIARGLAYLHSTHVVWFDCKPSNVLLDHTGVAKIADFGLARILESTCVSNRLVRQSNSVSCMVRC